MMVLEGQVAAAQDEIEKVENALLEVSALYDELVERNRKLVGENEQMFSVLSRLPFEVWKESMDKGQVEVSISSQSDFGMNSMSTKKNAFEVIGKE